MKTNRRNYAIAFIAVAILIVVAIASCRADTVYVTDFQQVKVSGNGYIRIVFYKPDNKPMQAYIHIQDQNEHQMIRQSIPIEVTNPVWIKWRK